MASVLRTANKKVHANRTKTLFSRAEKKTSNAKTNEWPVYRTNFHSSFIFFFTRYLSLKSAWKRNENNRRRKRKNRMNFERFFYACVSFRVNGHKCWDISRFFFIFFFCLFSLFCAFCKTHNALKVKSCIHSARPIHTQCETEQRMNESKLFSARFT